MFTIIESDEFKAWYDALRDDMAKSKIDVRIRRAAMGNLGDWKSLGDGVSEMRIDHGPGYRMYFARRERVVVVLLCGGDKRTQNADIKRAKAILNDF